jgi:hypothetical protein
LFDFHFPKNPEPVVINKIKFLPNTGKMIMLNGYRLWWEKIQVVRTKGEPRLIFTTGTGITSWFLVLFRYGTRTENPGPFFFLNDRTGG